ncbi:MAG: zinc-dependent metalloprotease, partial [Planctomycetota bacterium]
LRRDRPRRDDDRAVPPADADAPPGRSEIPNSTGYKPRKADQRIGYFTTTYIDLGKYNNETKYQRYINRWKIEKADPKLSMSPPKEPIVFYIDHTVPVRYRRFVRNGIEYWNEAFEAIGITGAIEVYQQDARTGAHMDKDPEDNRYNFIRWLSNDITTAVGPSRVHPETGQILDADVVLTDGWLRVFEYQFRDQFPKIAMDGFTPETYAWLAQNPQWSPEVRFATPEQRPEVMREVAARANQPFGGHPLFQPSPYLFEHDHEQWDLGTGSFTQMHLNCRCAEFKGMQMAQLAHSLQLEGLLNRDDDGDGKPDDQGDMIDGIPENFVGVLLQDLVAHEVGHCIGLRHNFKASAIYDLDEINSEEIKGKEAYTASVMDYNPTNIVLPDKFQGDFGMIKVGPYDMIAVEFGYGDGKNNDELFKRMAEEGIPYLTDEDTFSSDPLARRYDFSANPLDFAKQQMDLARYHRERLLDEFVKDGESWARARQGYSMTLGMQLSSNTMMTNWIGGAFATRAKKGDPVDQAPITPVDADTQREALDFVIKNSFRDEAWDLSPELLQHLSVDKWFGGAGGFAADYAWDVHDSILGFQASTMTQLFNPTTVKRVYDNEFRVPADEDAFTLAELMETVAIEVWSELDQATNGRYTAREPMISSLRRNLQREHVERMIDLVKPDNFYGAAKKPVSNLSRHYLRELKEMVDETLESNATKLDPYTLAHLSEVSHRIDASLDAEVIYNTDDLSQGAFNLGGLFLATEE